MFKYKIFNHSVLSDTISHVSRTPFPPSPCQIRPLFICSCPERTPRHRHSATSLASPFHSFVHPGTKSKEVTPLFSNHSTLFWKAPGLYSGPYLPSPGIMLETPTPDGASI